MRDRIEGRRRSNDRRGRATIDLDTHEEEATLADEELAARAGRGDEQAFLELYRRYQDLVWRISRAITLLDDEAMAAVIDSFLQVTGLHAFADSAGGRPGAEEAAGESVAAGESDPMGATAVPFRTALAAGARDAALDRLRRRRSGRQPLNDHLIGGERGDEGLSPPAPDEMVRILRTVVPPPPPELWALVRVAWRDRIQDQWDHLRLARRVVEQLP